LLYSTLYDQNIKDGSMGVVRYNSISEYFFSRNIHLFKKKKRKKKEKKMCSDKEMFSKMCMAPVLVA